MKNLDYKQYLGEDIYANFNGTSIILTIQNNDGFPTDMIMLSYPRTISELSLYIDRIKKVLKDGQN